ncbi:hypothetical protein AQ759_09390 [Burkholderia pseudomallei]|nr:hypothetical protein AQ759_09390 [Burkholderia pseudomallei]OMT63739.1 hypothetical protein AQ761_24910 [Burkholderia pseudomallei]
MRHTPAHARRTYRTSGSRRQFAAARIAARPSTPARTHRNKLDDATGQIAATRAGVRSQPAR